MNDQEWMREALAEARRAEKKRPKADRGEIRLAVNGKAQLDDGRTWERGDDKFPPWRQVVPGMTENVGTDEIKATFGINPFLLLEACKAIGANGKSGCVKVIVRGELDPIVVESNDGAYAVVMPCRL